ncbi:uncharacterized protein FRV6_14690 [Fusarium oxysporum]|uniref:Uncharacterized protein n=1 Tax=Fusarium oxysporum TaxID=5507 RepID=A0A2H3TPF2_FUSOX|nr:uncharacterized protein FRV6_14690 [Fusarium oxysporum]
MKAFSFYILLGALFSRADAAEQKHIDEAYSDVWGVINCDSSITYPNYPRPLNDINGIQIDTEIVPKEVNICDAVRDALGSDDFVNNAETYCTCLSNAVYWGSSSNAKPSFDGQINAHITGPYLDWIHKEETRLSNNDYTITTDRAPVVKNQLAATNGWTFVQAPEIDVATYKRLSKAVMSCYTGTCDGPKVRAFLASYVENADSVINSDFVRMLNKWVALFETLKKRTKDVQNYSKQVQARLKTVACKVNSVKANVCKNNAFKSLQGVPIAAGKALANIPKMTQITLNAIKYTTTPDEAIIKAFRVTQYLPQAAEDLKKLTGTFNLISNHAGVAKTAATSIDQILSANWVRNSELSKTASGRKVRDGLINIQRGFRNDLTGPLDNLIKANKAVEDILIQLPLRKKRLEFSSGCVSYSRWTNARMPVLCKKEDTKFYLIGGFPASYTYQQVQTCEFGPTKVPFIKNVIPYMRYRFV